MSQPRSDASPRVSVLMATYNGARLIAESIDSVLAQSLRDWELVVVDDGSTDGTPDLLSAYATRDSRIRVLRTPGNLGVVGARNFGFVACLGTYLAALDHDDISHPERLAAQAAYLDATPKVVLLGTGVMLIQGERRSPKHHAPGSPLLMRWSLHTGNPLTWSSVMMRMEAARRLPVFLRAEYEFADDFDLYHRMLALGEIAQLDRVLTTYRWHATNTTHAKSDLIFSRGAEILAAACRPWLGADAMADARLLLRHLSDRRPPRDLASLDRLGDVLGRILAGFCDDNSLTAAECAVVEAEAASAWWQAVRSAVRAGLPAAIRCHARHPALCRGALPSIGDRLASIAVGTVRSAGPVRSVMARLTHRRP